MNPGGHRANEYRANSLASTSSQNYNDFIPQQQPNQQLYNIDIPQQRQQQHQHQHQLQQHQPSPSMSVQPPHNQWQQHAMQMNAPQMLNSSPQVQQQIPPPFTQMPWGNQMPPPQGFPNGMPGMGFNFFPQSILQEAYAMSAPVEAADEPFLLSKLLASSRKGESYKDSLNSLHGKNGHSASLWKDYYLDHRERIDAWIAMCLEKEKEKAKESRKAEKAVASDLGRVKISQPAIKKPYPATFKREPSPYNSTVRLSISAPPVKRGRPRKKAPSTHSTPPVVVEQPTAGRRSTINSITTPAPVFAGRLTAPNADIKIPDPPSRSPTPPTTVVPHRGRGNKYTQEDRNFFIKFIGWRLKHDPTLTRNDLCELLELKAPHHTAQSWASHWSGNHDVPDKILAAARGEDVDDGDDSDSSVEVTAVKRKPVYKDLSTTDEEEDEDEEEEASEDEGDEDEEDDDNDIQIKRYSEKDMGQSGEAFTDADLYITAKYIASKPNWDILPSKDRWDPYAEKYSQRSAKSWAEYYRRNEQPLLSLSRKIRRRSNADSSKKNTQCARPTWSSTKRKAENTSNDDASTKRGRT